MRTPAGYFFGPKRMLYPKPALSLSAQLSLLEQRGMSIPDRQRALHYLAHLNYYRHLRAHHSRVWNRRFTATMKIPKHPANLGRNFHPNKDRQIYNTLVMLHHLISVISPDSCWRLGLFQATTDHPLADPVQMGFPAGWESWPVWAR